MLHYLSFGLFPPKHGKEAGVAGTQREWRRAVRERVEGAAAQGHVGE